jgi:RNA-directed DNA polymerase
MTQSNAQKPFKIDRRALYHAWEDVNRNRGSSGIDGVELSDYERNLKGNLYKLWNRMSSGCYMPQPVRLVEIPKTGGGSRPLGIPTVEDRIAQMLAVRLIEPSIDKVFHPDSYGYHPHRSAHDATGKARERCWKYNWVLDMDISKFFDTIDHTLLMKAIVLHVQEKWILLYIRRWFTVPYKTPDGKETERSCGVPQGSVAGPLLANLYLHYSFDRWMERHNPHIPFERYADDTVCHCRSEKEALELREALESRLTACKLQLHPAKTKTVYCKDSRRRLDYEHVTFDFSGHRFRPCKTMNRSQRKTFTGFQPSISAKSTKRIKETMRSWKLKSKSHTPLSLIAQQVNPVLRGWMNCYGKYSHQGIKHIMEDFNGMLVRWAKAKYKRFRRKSISLACKWLGSLAARNPMFYHWQEGVYSQSEKY